MTEQLKEAITQETAHILTSGSDSQLVVAHPTCSVMSRGQVGVERAEKLSSFLINSLFLKTIKKELVIKY